jgi:hypothetical protein
LNACGDYILATTEDVAFGNAPRVKPGR